MEATLQAARPIRGPHGGWQKQEIDALQQSVEAAERSGESLRSVFERMSRQLGRKPNSIRNFYYAQVRAAQGEDGARATPFETFSPEEVERLVEQVLTARAQGVSVRACVRQMADGDRTRMLRYQNKYRSTVRTRPEIVRRVMDRLNEQGRAFVSPYGQEAGGAELAALKTARRKAATRTSASCSNRWIICWRARWKSPRTTAARSAGRTGSARAATCCASRWTTSRSALAD